MGDFLGLIRGLSYEIRLDNNINMILSVFLVVVLRQTTNNQKRNARFSSSEYRRNSRLLYRRQAMDQVSVTSSTHETPHALFSSKSNAHNHVSLIFLNMAIVHATYQTIPFLRCNSPFIIRSSHPPSPIIGSSHCRRRTTLFSPHSLLCR